MAKRVIQLYDKYKSTTKVYPLIIGECLTDDAKETIKCIADKEIEDNVPDIIANVELAGTEAELTSLQIGDTKYKIGGGKQLYQHNIFLSSTGYLAKISVSIISESSTSMTLNDLKTWLNNKGFNNVSTLYCLVGGYYGSTVSNHNMLVGGLIGIFNNNGTLRLSFANYNGSTWVETGINIDTLDTDKVITL